MGCSTAQFALLIRLNYLARDIVTAVFGGMQPSGLNRKALLVSNVGQCSECFMGSRCPSEASIHITSTGAICGRAPDSSNSPTICSVKICINEKSDSDVPWIRRVPGSVGSMSVLGDPRPEARKLDSYPTRRPQRLARGLSGQFRVRH